MLLHGNTKDRERVAEGWRGGRLSPQAKLTQTDNFKVKTVVYLVEGKKWEEQDGEGGRGKKGGKIYLIRECQESVFTCKIASE